MEMQELHWQSEQALVMVILAQWLNLSVSCWTFVMAMMKTSTTRSSCGYANGMQNWTNSSPETNRKTKLEPSSCSFKLA